MTDITELAQSLKAAAEKATHGPWALSRDRKTVVSNQSHPIANLSDAMHRMLADGTTGKDAEFISLANPANILALVEALEKAQRANGHLREQSAEWERKAISNFEECAKLSQRVEELESRTVKMPEPFKLAKSSSGLTYYFADDVDAALTAAGIKVEGE